MRAVTSGLVFPGIKRLVNPFCLQKLKNLTNAPARLLVLANRLETDLFTIHKAAQSASPALARSERKSAPGWTRSACLFITQNAARFLQNSRRSWATLRRTTSRSTLCCRFVTYLCLRCPSMLLPHTSSTKNRCSGCQTVLVSSISGAASSLTRLHLSLHSSQENWTASRLTFSKKNQSFQRSCWIDGIRSSRRISVHPLLKLQSRQRIRACKTFSTTIITNVLTVSMLDT